MSIDDLKEKVARACRILYNEGHADYIWGHVSARVPGTDTYWMKPHHFGLEEVSADDLILIDFDGVKIGGADRRRHGEFPIHSEIYRLRPDVACVVHTHPFFATILANTGEPILPLTHDGVYFVGSLSHYSETSELIVNSAQGEDLAKCLGSNRAILMRNHGIVTVGASIEEATETAIILERAAKTQIISMSTGISMMSSTDAEVQTKLEQHFTSNFYDGLWAYLNRKYF